MTTGIPARFAARTPFGASSKTRIFSGGIPPKISAAFKKRSGSGFALATSSPQTTISKFLKNSV
jgi:hypothetical protein